MEIIVGRTAGFCYGVKRAVDGAKELLKENKNKSYCLGEIVHNKEVINSLKEQGLEFIDDVSEAQDTTIIRAHGISRENYEKLKHNNIKIKDYTCPNVIKIHDIVQEYSNKGYYIFLTGSKNHPENIGTISFCGNNCFIIEQEDDVLEAMNKFDNSKINKLLLISQTTYSLEKFYEIQKIIENKISNGIELVVKNTICASTKIRQKETEEIAKKVDYMIIIGGKNSSNTKKLFNIAKNFCNKCICIQNASEINIQELEKIDCIGVMAGASTPKSSINNVIRLLEKL